MVPEHTTYSRACTTHTPQLKESAVPAHRHTYLVRLDPLILGDNATPHGVRDQFFDRLETTDAEVVQLKGADRVVISCSDELADQIRDLEYILDVEPYTRG
jgi:hypothetical protein